MPYLCRQSAPWSDAAPCPLCRAAGDCRCRGLSELRSTHRRSPAVPVRPARVATTVLPAVSIAAAHRNSLARHKRAGRRPMAKNTVRHLADRKFATGVKSDVRNTLTTFSPPTVTYANCPLAVRAKLTWFVIGPVSSTFRIAKGGRASNATVLPMSFSVNHTCLPSGVAAMLGQKGLGCATCPTCAWVATSNTAKPD